MKNTEQILVENLREALRGSERYVLTTISAAISLLLLQIATSRLEWRGIQITLPGLVVAANSTDLRLILIAVIFILPALATAAIRHANKIAKKILTMEVHDAALTYPSLVTDEDPWIRKGSALLPIIPVLFSQLIWHSSQDEKDWFEFIFWLLMLVMPSIVLAIELRNPVGYITGSSTQAEPLKPKQLLKKYDYLAPDGSEIRLLSKTSNGGMAHCTLPKGGVSKAVKHKTVEELWYFISGKGEVWRKQEDGTQRTDKVTQGTTMTIPTGTSFQLRNSGEEPLCFIITTMPPWPGKEEAIETEGKW